MKIGVTDYVKRPFDIERRVLPDHYEIVELALNSENELCEHALEDLDALLVWHAPINSRIASMLTSCKVVVRYGVGFDAIDVAALDRNAIPFCNTPDYGTEEVADSAAAMILHFARRVGEYDFQCRSYSSGWQENTLPGLRRLSSITVGIIGVGRIGMSVVKRLQAFGIKVVGFDPYQVAGHEKALGYERLSSLSELLARADIVSAHCPSNATSKGMINEQFIRSMKPGSVLVNTARGSLVTSLDPIYNALKDNHLYAVGFDVLPTEPPDEHHDLIRSWKSDCAWLRGRVLITPHVAYFSEEAYVEMREKAAETVALYLERGVLRNRIRPHD